MKTFILATLLLVVSTPTEANPVSRRLFRVVPVAEAHESWGEAVSSQLPAEDIDVLVWNIKKTEEDPWQIEFLRYGLAKDLLLVQEAYRGTLFEKTLQLFWGRRWDMAVSFKALYDKETATGVMVGAAADPLDVKVEHTKDREPLVNTPKATIYAKYPLRGVREDLLVISVHGINITSLGAFKRHMQQMKTQIEKHSGPVLWAGDFNTRTKKRTRYMEEMTRELGFEEVKFKNGQHRMVFKFTKNYLDHAFVRGLKVKAAEVIPDSSGSDHKPMLLTVSVAD